MEIRTLAAVLVLATVMAVPMQDYVANLQPDHTTWDSDDLDSAVSLLQTLVSSQDAASPGHRAAIKLLTTQRAAVQAKASMAGAVHTEAVKLASSKADKLTQKHSVCNVKLKLIKQKARKARLVIEELEAKAAKLDPKAARRWRSEWVSPVAREARTAARIAKKNLRKMARSKRRTLRQMKRNKRDSTRMARKARRATREGMLAINAATRQNNKRLRRALKRLELHGARIRRKGKRVGVMTEMAVNLLKKKAEKAISREKHVAAREIATAKSKADTSLKREAKALMKDMAVRVAEEASKGKKKRVKRLSAADLMKPQHAQVIAAVVAKHTNKTEVSSKSEKSMRKHMKEEGDEKIKQIHREHLKKKGDEKIKSEKAMRKHMKEKGDEKIKQIVKNGKSTSTKSSAKIEAALKKSLKDNDKVLKSIAEGKQPKKTTTH